MFFQLNDHLTLERGYLVQIDVCGIWFTGYLSAFMGLCFPPKFQFEGKVIFFITFLFWWCHHHFIWYYTFNKDVASFQYKIDYFTKHLYIYIYIYLLLHYCFSTWVSIELGPWLYSLCLWSLKPCWVENHPKLIQGVSCDTKLFLFYWFSSLELYHMYTCSTSYSCSN